MPDPVGSSSVSPIPTPTPIVSAVGAKAIPGAGWFDAHNHLQDARLGSLEQKSALVQTCLDAGLKRMVVNGSCEEDWPEVATLASRFPCVLPSFGYHPWYVHEATPHWEAELNKALDAHPSVIGEIGLDRWTPHPDLDRQQHFFLVQLKMAVDRSLPVSIHCLKAWGWLSELLRRESLPKRGFLLHSYGGPVELVQPLARLGAYFSFPGYYLHERKERQRETFKHIPWDRLLVETDAPDQLLPEAVNQHPLTSHADGTMVNHPANIVAVYEGLARIRGVELDALASQVAENFNRLFVG